MLKRAVYDNGDGTVMVRTLAANSRLTDAQGFAQNRNGRAMKILPETVELPDKLFRSAWVFGPQGVRVSLTKAKKHAHKLRRAKRDERFAPLDRRATVPSDFDAAESARQSIRVSDAQLQVNMDASTDAVTLKQLMQDGGLIL
jgi:hypothetical protein